MRTLLNVCAGAFAILMPMTTFGDMGQFVPVTPDGSETEYHMLNDKRSAILTHDLLQIDSDDVDNQDVLGSAIFRVVAAPDSGFYFIERYASEGITRMKVNAAGNVVFQVGSSGSWAQWRLVPCGSGTCQNPSAVFLELRGGPDGPKRLIVRSDGIVELTSASNNWKSMQFNFTHVDNDILYEDECDPVEDPSCEVM